MVGPSFFFNYRQDATASFFCSFLLPCFICRDPKALTASYQSRWKQGHHKLRRMPAIECIREDKKKQQDQEKEEEQQDKEKEEQQADHHTSAFPLLAHEES